MPSAIEAEAQDETITSEPMAVFLARQEQLYIVEAMKLAEGNATKAAMIAGISKPTFYRKIAQHGIRVVRKAPEIVAGHYDD